MIDEPILEEVGDEQDTEGAEGVHVSRNLHVHQFKTHSSIAIGDTRETLNRAQSMQTRDLTHLNEPVEESVLLTTFDRKRAKSYPSDMPNEPAPMMELPKQPQTIQVEEEENRVGENKNNEWTKLI